MQGIQCHCWAGADHTRAGLGRGMLLLLRLLSSLLVLMLLLRLLLLVLTLLVLTLLVLTLALPCPSVPNQEPRCL